MLKIRDNVDKKELEKFGFKKDYYVDEKVYVYRFEIGTSYKEEIIVWTSDKSIQVSCGIKTLTILYDLIQAGLVEKVE